MFDVSLREDDLRRSKHVGVLVDCTFVGITCYSLEHIKRLQHRCENLKCPK